MSGAERDRQLLHDLVGFTGMKPAKLAREAGVAVTTINRPYAGTVSTRLSQGTVDKLRRRFGYFPGWGDYLGADPQPSDAVEAAYTIEELGVLDLIRSLSSSDRALVMQIANRLRRDAMNASTEGADQAIDFWDKQRDRREK